MQTRRSLLCALAGGCVATLAGCPLLENVTEQAADPAAVTGGVLAQPDFEHRETSEETIEETVTVGGESREVTLTNWLTRYTRPLPGVEADAVRFTILATPTVSVADRSVNPFQQFDEARLVQAMVQRQAGAPIENVTATGERTVAVLGEDVTVTQFDAETTAEGIALCLHLGDLTHEGDVLVLFGLHPELFDESEAIYTLAGGVDHPVERPQN